MTFIDVEKLLATSETLRLFGVLNLAAEETRTSDTFTGLDTGGQLAVTASLIGMLGTVTITIEGRATDEDEWSTLDTLVLTENGQAVSIVTPLPQLRVSVVSDVESGCRSCEVAARPLPSCSAAIAAAMATQTFDSGAGTAADLAALLHDTFGLTVTGPS